MKRNRNHAIYVIDGVQYVWSGWFGCQLESLQWVCPKPAERRTLRGVAPAAGHEDYVITLYSAQRQGLKVRCTWRLIQREGWQEYGERIVQFQEALRRL
jgi:hypothetical protein